MPSAFCNYNQYILEAQDWSHQHIQMEGKEKTVLLKETIINSHGNKA